MKKVITLQIGQCGNEIGHEFWKRLALEHGIASDGVLEDPSNSLEDRKDVFFYPADDGRYIPRSILIDLEPRVISGIQHSEYSNFYNPENIFLGKEGSGAGNNWAIGYSAGEDNYEEISDMVRREVEVADALEGFIFTHSIAGGTGSGMGSLLIERLSDEYKKATTMAYSVFPGNESTVVVQPYNSILTLRRLSENADAVVVIDNSALASIVTKKLNRHGNEDQANEDQINEEDRQKNSYAKMNMLVSTVMAATTATLRFPSYSNNDLVSLLAPLIPTPSCHFLMTGYTPISLPTVRQIVTKTSVIDVMNRLLDQKNIMVSTDMSKGMYVSILNILQGEIDPTEIHTALRQVRENKKLRFIPWGPASLQLALSRKSPYVEMPNRVSGLMLANHTNVRGLFESLIKDFKRLYASKAYFQQYEKSSALAGRVTDEFNESLAAVTKVCKEYEDAERDDFLTFDDE